LAARSSAEERCTADGEPADSKSSRTAELMVKGHRLIAEGHACLAEANRLRIGESRAQRAPSPSWIPARDSPLGNRLTLAKCRSGEIESAKIGRKVFLRRASLAEYVERHRRNRPRPDEDEDLFGAAS
jgi:hypothetical protein